MPLIERAPRRRRSGGSLTTLVSAFGRQELCHRLGGKFWTLDKRHGGTKAFFSLLHIATGVEHFTLIDIPRKSWEGSFFRHFPHTSYLISGCLLTSSRGRMGHCGASFVYLSRLDFSFFFFYLTRAESESNMNLSKQA
ncbi:hypothetical protein HBI23_013740 [Parastagonospora nodorum]|nr:hypothetical protein HBH72_101170 [Parastagonospora nodorum]KAH5125253.1 hypothetical protein HBH71_004490 [Parastagonospora nodorum]KAH5437797.1 hypothetical protein HBI32_031310 [Parastagonospora nodorum]KAH5690544.1 hypothetical protein HBI23_013740 [Parastagonospora nodorum]